MNKEKFILTTDECELLLALEAVSGIERLAKIVNRDTSNVSRSLTKIAEKLPVIEKKSGKWVLTEIGRRFNQHSRDAVHFQNSLFEKQQILRLGSNREFASRILGPRLKDLQELFPATHIRITSFEQGTEQALLDGLVDIGIDCERPFDPEISYKTLIQEPIIAVSSPGFKKTHEKELRSGALMQLPHLLCDRLFPDKILDQTQNLQNVLASFNDIATTRAACEEGLGWALLPQYAVRKELEAKSLVHLTLKEEGRSNYGIWWLRGRKHLDGPTTLLSKWLKDQDL